jgi:hypothetical protein
MPPRSAVLGEDGGVDEQLGVSVSFASQRSSHPYHEESAPSGVDPQSGNVERHEVVSFAIVSLETPLDGVNEASTECIAERVLRAEVEAGEPFPCKRQLELEAKVAGRGSFDFGRPGKGSPS